MAVSCVDTDSANAGGRRRGNCKTLAFGCGSSILPRPTSLLLARVRPLGAMGRRYEPMRPRSTASVYVSCVRTAPGAWWRRCGRRPVKGRLNLDGDGQADWRGQFSEMRRPSGYVGQGPVLGDQLSSSRSVPCPMRRHGVRTC